MGKPRMPEHEAKLMDKFLQKHMLFGASGKSKELKITAAKDKADDFNGLYFWDLYGARKFYDNPINRFKEWVVKRKPDEDDLSPEIYKHAVKFATKMKKNGTVHVINKEKLLEHLKSNGIDHRIIKDPNHTGSFVLQVFGKDVIIPKHVYSTHEVKPMDYEKLKNKLLNLAKKSP